MSIPSCALTDKDLQTQRERLDRLGASVAGFERGEDRIAIEFEAGFDRRLLDQIVAIERECCPFFRFELEPSTRQLTVSVAVAAPPGPRRARLRAR